MMGIWWVVVYVVIGMIASVLFIRIDDTDFDEWNIQKFGALWFIPAIHYVIKFLFYWIPDKLDDGIWWIQMRGWEK